MILSIILLALLANPAVTGQVVDSRTGVPLEKVLIQVKDTGQSTQSDSEGRFRIEPIKSGRHLLYISVVGYIVVRREVEVTESGPLDLKIPLTEGTGDYSEKVTVTAEIFESPEPAVPSQHSLGNAEIQNLRGVLADDPLRAVQVLPGVTSSDDFRSEFSVRGSDFRHVGVSLDGVATPTLLHTVRSYQETGSVAMINSDTLENLVLWNGAYPQRFGNRTGAQLDFFSRSGSRDRTQTRVAISGTNASFVVDGPLPGKRGSWLVSARKSYLDLLIRRISDDYDFNFGFSDFQTKFTLDLSSANQLELLAIAGRGHLDDRPEDIGVNEVHEGWNRAALVNLTLKTIGGPRTVLTQRLYVVGSSFRNENRDRIELDGGRQMEFSYRADVSFSARPDLVVEGGVHFRHVSQDARQRRYDFGRRQFDLWDRYDASADAQGGYTSLRWTAGKVSITPGVRFDRWTLTGDGTASPWIQAEVNLSDSSRLKFGTGLYQQFPDFEHVSGLRGRSDLKAERAAHYDAGFEQRLGNNGRWQMTFYDREERRFLRLPNSEARLVGGIVRFPVQTSRWENSLNGYSRGVEFMVQRRSPNGLSGWLSYSLGFTRHRDAIRNEAFWSDFDQRHTLNLYGLYRLSDRSSVSAKFRAGSNFPIAGYYERRGDDYFVSEQRNRERLPVYSRLDVRANRTFNFDRSRITLFVEVLNVYNRKNQRAGIPSINANTRRVSRLLDKLIPLVPSAGILVEF